MVKALSTHVLVGVSLILLLGQSSNPAVAQGLLIASQSDPAFRLPRPVPLPNPDQPGVLYDIEKLEIDASIRGQVAEIQVAQTFKNRSSQVLQVQYVFPLPHDAAIDQMTFLVDGQELEGRLLEADKAREIYKSYVRRSRDPALIRWIGTGMFRTQVFPVPPGADRTVSLRYTQLCSRRGEMNDWLLPLAAASYTSKPIREVAIRGRIRSQSKIGNVYSPTHDIELDRNGKQIVEFQYVARNHVPESDFRLLWDTGNQDVQMSLVTHRPDEGEDGYFMLMLQPQLPDSPEVTKKIGKNLLLVLDKSGSMRGEKISQTRHAAHHVIDHLRRRDRFGLISYDSKIETFRSELSSADKEIRLDAEEYIDSILAGGSTNIDGALAEALQLASHADGPAYVVFMTDGQPTVGEKNAMKIAANAEAKLTAGTRLFSLGVGHDVNSRLLDKLASICLGQTIYVQPGESIDQAIETLWNRISAPALTDAKIQILVDGKEGRTRQLYPSAMYDLFSGDQLVIVGRYRKSGRVEVRLTGDYLDEKQAYEFEDELPRRTETSKNVFVERLWATRRIGEIIDDIDLHGENQELVDELILLSKRHGILTPYTAYLAEEQTDLNDVRGSRQLSLQQLRKLDQEVGESAFMQRSLKSQFRLADRGAPAGVSNNVGDQSEGALGLGGGLSGGGNRANAIGPAAPAAGSPATNLPGLPGNPGMAGGPGLPGNADKEGAKQKSQSVKRIGSKTFYLRQDCYIDSEANDQQIKDALNVEQFSDAYFKILDSMNETESLYFAEDQDLVVLLKGKCYRVKVAR